MFITVFKQILSNENLRNEDLAAFVIFFIANFGESQRKWSIRKAHNLQLEYLKPV